MSNPTVYATPEMTDENYPSLDNHSTTDRSRATMGFREQSLQLVEALHRRTLGVYQYISDHGGHSLRRQYERCRTDAWVVQHEDTLELRVASRKCNQRWCPMCQKTKRWIITNAVTDWAETKQHVKFVTFTLRSCHASLELQVERLYESFQKIRKSKLWRQSVRGGVWFFQLTMNKSTRLWHPHIHVLVDSDYIKQRLLSQLWESITFDSKIVDIRKVHNAEDAADYVARYATVPGDLLKCTVAEGAAMMIGLKGRRLCGSFGNAKGLVLRPRGGDDHSKWRKVLSWFAVQVGAKFDPMIEMIMKTLAQGKPFDGEIWGLYDSPDIPGSSLEFEPITVHQLLFEFESVWYVPGVC